MKSKARRPTLVTVTEPSYDSPGASSMTCSEGLMDMTRSPTSRAATGVGVGRNRPRSRAGRVRR